MLLRFLRRLIDKENHPTPLLGDFQITFVVYLLMEKQIELRFGGLRGLVGLEDTRDERENMVLYQSVIKVEYSLDRSRIVPK